MGNAGTRRVTGWMALALAFALSTFATRPAAATDERIAYLIETLEESINYRVRVQTIESLDQIAVTASGDDLQTIVAAISDTLDDANALVRYTAASTLVGLARTSLRTAEITTLVAKLEKMKDDADADVRRLAGDSLPGIQSRLDQLRGTSSSGGGSGTPAPTRFYVAVGTLGDSSNVGRDDIDDLARAYLLEELRVVSAVEAHGEIPAASAFRTELQRRNLLGFVLQGSVVSLTRSGNAVSAVVSILVLDQDQNLRVMLRGNGNAQRRSGTLTDEEVPSVQADALRAAVHAAVASLAGYLRDL